MSERLLAQIDAKLNELIQRYERLDRDYRALRAKEEAWVEERARLLEKNEIAKTRIEAMVDRLTKLEDKLE